MLQQYLQAAMDLSSARATTFHTRHHYITWITLRTCKCMYHSPSSIWISCISTHPAFSSPRPWEFARFTFAQSTLRLMTSDLSTYPCTLFVRPTRSHRPTAVQSSSHTLAQASFVSGILQQNILHLKSSGRSAQALVHASPPWNVTTLWLSGIVRGDGALQPPMAPPASLSQSDELTCRQLFDGPC